MKSIFKFIRSYIDTHRLFRGLEINNCSFVILDTETTGLEANMGDKIISLAALKIRNSLIQENEFLDELINPERDIPWESVKIHHITDEHVRGKPTLPELQSKINLFLKKSILIGHNIEFDKKFIYQDAVNSEYYDELWKIPFAKIKKKLCFVRDKNSKVKIKKKVIHFQEVRFLDYNLACAYTPVNFFPKIIYLDFSVFFSRCE